MYSVEITKKLKAAGLLSGDFAEANADAVKRLGWSRCHFLEILEVLSKTDPPEANVLGEVLTQENFTALVRNKNPQLLTCAFKNTATAFRDTAHSAPASSVGAPSQASSLGFVGQEIKRTDRERAAGENMARKIRQAQDQDATEEGLLSL